MVLTNMDENIFLKVIDVYNWPLTRKFNIKVLTFITFTS